jgi:hypothetical protein
MTAPRANRIPCINPRCRRTADGAKFEGDEIICGKCFRALPSEFRNKHRSLRRHEKKMLRLIAKRIVARSIEPAQVDELRDRMQARFDANWDRIKRYFVTPERPVGIEGFLAEVGL